MGKAADFERAEFSGARKADYRARWITLLFALLFLAVVYWIARDILYHRLVHGYAQKMFNELGCGSVESIGSVSVDGQGDVTLNTAEVYTHHGGERKLFFTTEELRLTLDGFPLRDERLRIMRVDLFKPQIYIRREHDSEWNTEWAFISPPGTERHRAEPARDDPWRDYGPPESGFPRNGVHIHDGTIHVTFAGATGKEATWRITGVHATMTREAGVIRVTPFLGDFYGGRITGQCEVTKAHPFTIRQLTVDIRDADVSKMAEGVSFITHPVKGRFNAVIALTFDRNKMKERPVMSGHCEITEGDLWAVPAFSGVIELLTLTKVSDRKIDTAVLEFTVEQGQVRVDKMHFLGYPVSLFGDGGVSLTGEWLDIVFVPRLGKSDWNSIIPIIGAPIDLLSNIFKGALVPVVLKGSFENPEVGVEPFHFLRPSVRQLMDEKAPR